MENTKALIFLLCRIMDVEAKDIPIRKQARAAEMFASRETQRRNHMRWWTGLQ